MRLSKSLSPARLFARTDSKIFGVRGLFTSNPQIIANKHAWQDPAKRKKIEHIALLLKGALMAEAKVGIKLNVPKAKLDTVVSMLPSLERTDRVSLFLS